MGYLLTGFGGIRCLCAVLKGFVCHHFANHGLLAFLLGVSTCTFTCVDSQYLISTVYTIHYLLPGRRRVTRLNVMY